MTVVILKVAVGLGFVIFVHELGHFLVAKLCGVKCEKFYLGFDIAGLKFCKFKWGETEYGIGILPLGGYVKMLGQEDNPARLREEMERAKAESGRAQPAASDSPSPAACPSLYDPRSFLAQSVPKRMAIISAGVVMNVIFAFLMAVVAFGIGVDQTPCVVGDVLPGEPAWQADLRAGDKILKIAGKEMKQFRDLQTAISLGNIDPKQGVPLEIDRPGVEHPFVVTVKPDPSRGASMIGVANPRTTQLARDRKTWRIQKRYPVIPGSAAARAEPPFRNGDRIVQIDETPITDYGQIVAELARKADKKITVVVERLRQGEDGKTLGEPERVAIAVEPNPMRHLGLSMKMGRVTAIQANSPAASTNIHRGDIITSPSGDPMMLPETLRRTAGTPVEMTLTAAGNEATKKVSVTPREPTEITYAADYNGPMAAAPVGVAYRVLNEVANVWPGSSADKAGLRAGDVIVKAKVMPAVKKDAQEPEFEQPEVQPLLFNEDNNNWPLLMSILQFRLPDTAVQLTFSRDGKEQTVTLTSSEATDWFNPDRGFLLEPLTFARKAASVGEAIVLGGRETIDDMTLVFRTLGAISTNRVSPRLLGGPWTIIQMAMAAADAGIAKFLLFLTVLSANLAVINFMPIPVLDGGHFVLLAYEGIRGKPANEHVQTVLAYIGLALILALMAWVLGLDFGLIPRR